MSVSWLSASCARTPPVVSHASTECTPTSVGAPVIATGEVLASFAGDEVDDYLQLMTTPTTALIASLSNHGELATTISTAPRDTTQLVLTTATSSDTRKVFIQYLQLHPIAKSFIAGSLSGTCSTLLFQPFDLLKTRIQNASFVVSSSGASAVTTPATPNRIGAILVDVVRNEQLSGLWRGTVPSLMRCVPGVGLHFCCLDTLQSHFCAGRQPKAAEALAFGMVSRSLAGILLIPVTVVKTRYESGVFVYKNITEALRHTYRHEGVRGLTSGLAPTLARDVPFSGIYYMFYTQLKALAFSTMHNASSTSTTQQSTQPSSKPSSFVTSSVVTFACGLNAGLLASVVTQPMDVVKTHMQLYPKQFPSSFSTVILILKQKGVQGLFSGLVPRMMRRTLMASMAWTVYEHMMTEVGLK